MHVGKPLLKVMAVTQDMVVVAGLPEGGRFPVLRAAYD